MKKIVPILLVTLLALIASGCVNEDLSANALSAAALLKTNDKPDNFSLKKAQRQNQAAADFADSKEDIMAGDSFLTYVEAAKIVDEASRPLTPVSGSSAGMLDAVANAAINQLQSSFTDLFSSIGTSNTSIDASSGSFNVGGGSTAPVTSSAGGSASGGATSSSPSSGSTTPTPAVDSDYQNLMNYFADFQNYQTVVDPIISQAGSNPWSARDLLIDDQTLVSLLLSSHTIFDFISSHPTVTDGDKVLASVGDTLASIYSLWGVGRYEAQSAYLMINLYYPVGGYVADAEAGLLLL